MSELRWEDTNNLLRHRGLNPIPVANEDYKDPIQSSDDDDGRNPKNVVIFEKKSLSAIQDTLHRLIDDCDRRQGLITDLIKTNNNLREELKVAKERSPSSFAPPVEAPTAVVSGNVNNNNNNDASTHAKDSEGRATRAFPLLRQERPGHSQGNATIKAENAAKELKEIKRRLLEMEAEEERRRRRQDVIFRQLKKRSARGSSSNDAKMLDVIDMYERELERIEKDRGLETPSSPASRLSSSPASVVAFPPSARTKIMEKLPSAHGNNPHSTSPVVSMRNYDKELREAEEAMRGWKLEMGRLKEDIESRPTVDDLVSAQNRILELEKKLEAEKNSGLGHRDLNYSPRSAGVDEAVLCLDKLKEKLGVSSSLDVVGKVEHLAQTQSDAKKAEKVLRRIADIVDGDETSKHKTWCNSSNPKLIETLKRWRVEVTQIDAAQKTAEQLHLKLLGEPFQSTGKTTTKSVVRILENLTKNNSLPSFENAKTVKEANSRTLTVIVSHFQNLFDVKELPNVVTRINDVYNKINEMQNIMKALREILGLTEKSPGGWAVVDAVAQLSNAVNATATRQLQEVLGVKDLETVVQQIGEHQEFCPVFTIILQKVMETLVVDSPDKVLPAIQSLKLLATPAPVHDIVEV